MTDYRYIEEDILEASETFNPIGTAFDPHNATELYIRMNDEGVKMVEVRPTVLNFSEPMKL